MKLLKCALALILYWIGIEVISLWSLLAALEGFHFLFSYYQFIQGTLQAAAVLLFIQLFTSSKLKSLPQPTPKIWYLAAAGLSTTFIFAREVLSRFYTVITGTEYLVGYEFNGLQRFAELNILSTILLAPIGEELFFRQYIQKALQNSYKPILAIAATTFLFTCIHIDILSLYYGAFPDLYRLYMICFLGLVSGFLYHKSKSVGPSIVVHICWNVLVTII